MALTHEDLEILKRPFELHQHEFHNGNVYLRENAICDRLDLIDPSWTNDIIKDHTRATGDGKLMAVCLMRITVKGVFRDGEGQAGAVTKKETGAETNEPEKSAATDALKRAARLFGIGRYLLDARGVSNMKELAVWLKGLPANGQVNSNGTGKQAAGNINTTWTKEQATQFQTHWKSQGLSNENIMAALDVTKLSEWKGTQDEADDAINDWLENNAPLVGEPDDYLDKMNTVDEMKPA